MQASDFSAEEEEEEPSLEGSHRFKGRRRSSYLESNGKLQNVASRTSDDELLQDFTTEFTRTGSKPKDNPNRVSNFRQTKTHTSRQLNLEPQKEPSVVLTDSERNSGRQSYTRSRERNNRYDRNKQFSSQAEAPVSESVPFHRNNDKIISRENKIRSRTQDQVLSNEEVTTPAKARFRQVIPTEEIFTNRDSNKKDNKNVVKGIPESDRDSARTFSGRTAETSSTRRSARTKDTVLENNTQTQRYSRRQNNVSSYQNTTNNNLEIPKQDVETRISNRRRVFENERTNPIPVPVQETSSVQRKSSFPKENIRVKSTFRSRTSNPSVLNSKDSDVLQKPTKFTFDSIGSKTSETSLLPRNDVPTLTEERLELEDPKSEVLLEVQTVSAISSKEETLNKALHARSRGNFGSQFPKRELLNTVPSHTQRRSQTDNETRLPYNVQRGKQRVFTEENNNEEIRRFRSRLNNNQPLSRVTSKDAIERDDVEGSQKVDRRHGGYETNMEVYESDSQKNISEQQLSVSSGRTTLSQRSGDSQTTIPPSRGRGHSRHGAGSQNEDEVSKIICPSNFIKRTVIK